MLKKKVLCSFWEVLPDDRIIAANVIRETGRRVLRVSKKKSEQGDLVVKQGCLGV